MGTNKNGTANRILYIYIYNTVLYRRVYSRSCEKRKHLPGKSIHSTKRQTPVSGYRRIYECGVINVTIIMRIMYIICCTFYNNIIIRIHIVVLKPLPQCLQSYTYRATGDRYTDEWRWRVCSGLGSTVTGRLYIIFLMLLLLLLPLLLLWSANRTRRTYIIIVIIIIITAVYPRRRRAILYYYIHTIKRQ